MLIREVKKKKFLPLNTTVLNSRHVNDYCYTSDCRNLFISNTFSLIFHGTRLYGVNVLFDVSDATLKHPAKDVLTFQKHAWLTNRYVWSLLVFVLVAIFITALVVTLSEAESRSVHPSKAQLFYL